METEHQEIEKLTPDETHSLEETNLIQISLFKRSSENPADWVDWANKNGEVFQKLIEANPKLVELYRQDPEAALDKIEKELEKKRVYH